jgi:hypothetical protein
MVNLKSWSHTKFGVVTKELSKIKKRMEKLELLDPPGHAQELHTLRSRMDELLYKEEMMWLQRSRVAWLKEGDRNTSYFHQKATGRAKKNKIRLLRKEDGQITKDKAEMEGMAREFFRQLYSADQGVRPSDLTQLFEPKISDDANATLCKEFIDEETSDALFQIGLLKAPRPDGFPAPFFQRNWNILKADVIKRVKEFFVSGHIPPVINETSIVLIPKKNDPMFL